MPPPMPPCAVPVVELPPEAFTPSSFEVTVAVPPAITMCCASRPSSDSVTVVVPAAMVRVLKALTPSSAAETVRVPPLMRTQPRPSSVSLSF